MGQAASLYWIPLSSLTKRLSCILSSTHKTANPAVSLETAHICSSFGGFRKCIIFVYHLLHQNVCAWPWDLGGGSVRTGQTEREDWQQRSGSGSLSDRHWLASLDMTLHLWVRLVPHQGNERDGPCDVIPKMSSSFPS